LYNKRSKAIKEGREQQYWSQISYQYMSAESSDEDDTGAKYYNVHKPSWRSQSIHCVVK
jgi:hypothetical protein